MCVCHWVMLLIYARNAISISIQVHVRCSLSLYLWKHTYRVFIIRISQYVRIYQWVLFFIIWLQCSIYLFISFLWLMNTFYHLTISIIMKLVICKKFILMRWKWEYVVVIAYSLTHCTLYPIIRNDKLLIQLIIRYSDVNTACKQYLKCTTNERMNVINEWQTEYAIFSINKLFQSKHFWLPSIWNAR